jgi:hypothetical protein
MRKTVLLYRHKHVYHYYYYYYCYYYYFSRTLGLVQVRTLPFVALVEEDQPLLPFHQPAADTTTPTSNSNPQDMIQLNPPWGLDRISANKGLDGLYQYSSTGECDTQRGLFY